MSVYRDRVLPFLINLSMRQERFAEYRGRVVPGAEGRVLELGIGSGLNLPFYSRSVRQVIGLDPSPRLLKMARDSQHFEPRRVELLQGSAEAVPLEDASVDTVVMTWTLCSVPDTRRALEDMRRVLRPSGRLLFVEHGRAPDPNVAWWQDRLTPYWRRLGGGCHLNRAMATLIEGAGFQFERLETSYMRGPKPMTFMYEGNARPR